MSLTIFAQNFSTYQGNATNGILRIYSNKNFQSTDLVMHSSGAVGSNSYFFSLSCNIIGGVITVPQFSHPLPVDTDEETTIFTAGVYTRNGQLILTVLANYRLSASLGSSTSWETIELFSKNNNIKVSGDTYTKEQINELLNGIVFPGVPDGNKGDVNVTSSGNVWTVNNLAITNSKVATGIDAVKIGGGAVNNTEYGYLDGVTSPIQPQITGKQGKFLPDANIISNVTQLDTAIATALANPTNTYNWILAASATIASVKVIPSNVYGEFVEGAQFVKSATGAIEFQGPGIVGDPLVPIFNGFAIGDVKWTGAYPIQFRPEWFGAVGDNSTDDLPAFNATLAAMQTVNPNGSGYFTGAYLLLRQGVTYFLNGTLNIRRPILMDNGVTSDYNQNATRLRFPANTPGIITQGISTFNGVASTTQTGQMCELQGFIVSGAAGSTNTVLSTNGLNLTLTGGSITSVSRRGNSDNTANPPICVSPGSTVTVNGYNYVVDPAVDYLATSTVPILKPRIYVDATNGSPTLNDQEGNGFPSNNDWAGQSLEINGTIYTISSHTTSVITLTGNFVGPAGTNLYTGTNTTGVKSQSGIASRLNIYHGLDVRIQSKFKNIRITGFAGNGVDMNSERYPSAFLGTEPNANNSWFERVSCDFNQGNGWDFYGINSNNFETHSINAENNRGFGYYESGTLGANHYSWHCAFNGQGAFSMTGFGTNNIMNCYTEGGQPSALLGDGTVVFSGDQAAGIDYYWGSPGFFQTNARDGGFETQGSFGIKKGQTTYNSVAAPKSFMLRLASGNEPPTLMAWGAGEDAANTGSGFPVTNAIVPCYYLAYNYYRTGWYSLGYGTNWSVVTPIIEMSGSTATEGTGHLGLPQGFYAGTSTARRNWQYVNTIPTSGVVGLGDIFWNNDIDLSTDPMGWVVTTAGTIGSGAVLTPFYANDNVTPIDDFYTDETTLGTVRETLYGSTIDAGQLVSNGDKVTAEYKVRLAANTHDKRFFVSFAGTDIIDITTAANGATVKVVSTLIRVNNTTVRASAEVTVNNTTPAENEVEITGLDLGANPYNYDFDGLTPSLAGDMTARFGNLLYIKAVPPDVTAPSVPTGLMGTALSTTSIEMSWDEAHD